MGIPRPSLVRRSGGRPAARLGLMGLLMVLTACGGGGGGGGEGGGGGDEFQIQVMLINLSKVPATVSSSSGGDAKTVEPCKFAQADFPLDDPFTITVNDQPVIDSSTLPGGTPGQGNSSVLMAVTVSKEGKPEVTTKPYGGRAGGLDKPTQLFVSGSCAK